MGFLWDMHKIFKMDLSKYKYFYVNGCSFTEGGGLEEESIFDDSVVPTYKKIYGISWDTRKDVNYGKRLEEILGIKCINDGKCGAGTERLVRTTYDFIFKNWDDKDSFFIILEKLDPYRSEVFYTKTNEFYIVNSTRGKDKNVEFNTATREYHNEKFKQDDLENQVIFKNWFNNHFDFEENFLKNERDFIGLYSFCKLNSIKIFVMEPNDYMFTNCFDSEDVIKFSDSEDSDSIFKWCRKNRLTIKDEIPNSTDSHPGYFGHIEYAKKLASFLGWEGEYPEHLIYEKKLL